MDTSLAALRREHADLWFVGEKLRDPGNIGTILRTGDAVGAAGLIGLHFLVLQYYRYDQR